ncbi:MAG TPA: hypothetical protein VEW04_05115 [Allosphingosinicella sp.]|nr:hypothetical protein [Allosphingosinicella sp.]
MNKLFVIAAAAPLALAACNAAAPANQTNAAAPAANASASAAPAEINAAGPADQVIGTRTVTATFTGWEMGDYLWANFTVPGGEPIAAQPGPSPIDLFLDAHRGQPMTIEVASVRTAIPEAGGMTEILRITGASTAEGHAASWWQHLSPADQAAAQRRFEEGALSGR